MKSTNNRMGGFITAEIIAVKDIASFEVQNNQVSITLKEGVNQNMLDNVKNGIEAQVTSSTQKSGELFNIDISIEVKDLIFLKNKAFNKYLAILEKPDGEMHVFGTPDFPLNLKVEPIYSKTASGRVGSVVIMTGKQPRNVLIVQ